MIFAETTAPDVLGNLGLALYVIAGFVGATASPWLLLAALDGVPNAMVRAVARILIAVAIAAIAFGLRHVS